MKREEAESFIELFKPFYKNKTVMIQEANVLLIGYLKLFPQ